MIYVDNLMDHGWVIRGKHTQSCHMWSDVGTDELIKFAVEMGLKKEWLQKGRAGKEHFDLTPKMRRSAIARGAKGEKVKTGMALLSSKSLVYLDQAPACTRKNEIMPLVLYAASLESGEKVVFLKHLETVNKKAHALYLKEMKF